jgi:hypothetical protein
LATEPDVNLLKSLQNWRSEQAREQRVPPYIIFHNKVLEAIASHQPETLAALEAISGVGPAKLEKYGEAVIAVVAEYLSGAQAAPASTRSRPPAQPQVKVDAQPQPDTPEPAPRPTATPGPIPVKGVTSGRVEAPAPGPVKASVRDSQNPGKAIIMVVTDLDGLLTTEGLAQLLTAGPDEVVSFSDHELFGAFHGQLALDEMLAQIQTLLQAKQLVLSRHRRLMLP